MNWQMFIHSIFQDFLAACKLRNISFNIEVLIEDLTLNRLKHEFAPRY